MKMTILLKVIFLLQCIPIHSFINVLPAIEMKKKDKQKKK